MERKIVQMDDTYWMNQYKKECEDLRSLLTIMADCILMQDFNEAHECKFDTELYEKAYELAEMFCTKKPQPASEGEP